jgi:hypothetical protein
MDQIQTFAGYFAELRPKQVRAGNSALEPGAGKLFVRGFPSGKDGGGRPVRVPQGSWLILNPALVICCRMQNATANFGDRRRLFAGLCYFLLFFTGCPARSARRSSV